MSAAQTRHNIPRKISTLFVASALAMLCFSSSFADDTNWWHKNANGDNAGCDEHDS